MRVFWNVVPAVVLLFAAVAFTLSIRAAIMHMTLPPAANCVRCEDASISDSFDKIIRALDDARRRG